MFKFKYKEKPKVRYFSFNDIIEGMRISCQCGMKEKAFDWKELSPNLRKFGIKHRIIKMCKTYGKIRRVPQGFIIKFG